MSMQKDGSINTTAMTAVSHYELRNCLDITLFGRSLVRHLAGSRLS